MKYNKGLILSSVVAVLLSGCVKPTGEANTTGTDTKTFDDTATSGTFAPTYADSEDVYNTGNSTGSSGTVYGTTTVDNGVDTSSTGVITPTDTTYGATDIYNNTSSASTTTYDNTTYGANSSATYGTNSSATYGTAPTYDNVVTTPTYGTAGGAYGNPNGTTGSGAEDYYGATNDTYGSSSATSSGGGYNNTYSSSSSSSSTYTPPPASSSHTRRYTTNHSYGNSSRGNSGSSAGGIHLQVAALKDYYSAVEYKNNLSLDPKYSAYVKKGSINKVIVTGLESRAAAKALAARQFPGAFIVGGSPLSSSSSSSSSYHNSYSSSSSSSSSSAHNGSSYSGNGIGVQVGAFSTYAGAKTAAKKAAGTRYTALVKTVESRGKKLYKAIVTGFSSVASARSAIASGEFGSAFLVTDLK